MPSRRRFFIYEGQCKWDNGLFQFFLVMEDILCMLTLWVIITKHTNISYKVSSATSKHKILKKQRAGFLQPAVFSQKEAVMKCE